MSSRRTARILALQCLFANEFLKEDPETITSRISESLNQRVEDFTFKLIKQAIEHEDKLDKLIKEHLRNWEYNRVSIFDRVLIKMAVTEMLYFPDIPVEVSINEALEISKGFCNLKSCRFINGMLDSIYKKLKKTNQIQKDISVKIASLQKTNSSKKGN
jgi:N utilization substance protein B